MVNVTMISNEKKKNNFFEFTCFLVTIRDFEGSEWVFTFLVSRLGPKNLKSNLGNPPKVLRKAPHQLAVFWHNF